MKNAMTEIQLIMMGVFNVNSNVLNFVMNVKMEYVYLVKIILN